MVGPGIAYAQGGPRHHPKTHLTVVGFKTRVIPLARKPKVPSVSFGRAGLRGWGPASLSLVAATGVTRDPRPRAWPVPGHPSQGFGPVRELHGGGFGERVRRPRAVESLDLAGEAFGIRVFEPARKPGSPSRDNITRTLSTIRRDSRISERAANSRGAVREWR